MEKPRFTTIASLILTGLFIIVSLRPGLVPSHRFLFLYFFFYIVVFTGWLMAEAAVPWTRGIVRLFVSFVLGTAHAFVILIVIALFHADVLIIRFVTPVVVVFLALWHGRTREWIREYFNVGDRERFRTDRFTSAFMLLLMILVAVMVLRVGDPFFYRRDSVDHVAYIRTISRSHEAFPERWYYPDGGMNTRDIRKGMMHALLGTVNGLTGYRETYRIWSLISVISSLFFMIALYCAGAVLFRRPSIGLLSVVLMLLFYRKGLTTYELVNNACGSSFGKNYYIAALTFLTLYLKKPKPAYLFLVAAASLAATWTHINFFVIIVYMFASLAVSFLAGSMKGKRGELLTRRLPALSVMVLLANIVYIVMRYVRDYAPGNPIHIHVQGTLYFTDRIYVLNPIVFFQNVGPLGLLSIASVILLWRNRRHRDTIRVFLTGVIAFLVLVFNPLWFPLLHERMSYLLMRFEIMIPSMLVAAYLVWEVWAKIRGRNRELAGWKAAVGGVLIVVLLGVPLWRTPQGFSYSKRKIEARRVYSYYNLFDLYDFVNGNCPEGSVFLSDPFTCFGLPAFTDQYVTCPYDQHSIPNDTTAVERVVASRIVFSGTAPVSEIVDQLRTYGARYIIVNGRIPWDVQTLYWKPDAVVARALYEKLSAHSDLFRLLYDHESIAVFEFLPGVAVPPGEGEVVELPFIGAPVSETDLNGMPGSGEPGIFVKGIATSRCTVARGDTFRVRITWVSSKEHPLKRYIGYLRFDTDFEKGFLYRESYGKIYRKALELRSKQRYRFRVDFNPLGGLFPPDTWPSHREVYEEVIVHVPWDIAPGRYRVSVKMTTKPEFPNYRMRDLFRNDDHFSGPLMGEITIR